MPKLEGAQLAEQYDGSPLPHPHWLEPKLDGLRGIAHVTNRSDLPLAGVKITSRNGKDFHNFDAVALDLAAIGVNDMVYDGELFLNDWNTTAHVCRSEKAVSEASDLTYTVFDILPADEWAQGYSAYTLESRRRVLEYAIRGRFHNLRLSPYVVVSTPEEVKQVAEEYRQQGYEGGMLKDPKAIYKRRRWKAWRKVKFTLDFDVPIVGVQEGEGRLVGTLGTLLLDHNGVGCEVGTGFSDAERDRLWKMNDKGLLIGKIAEVSVQEVTATGKFRFPVYHRLRDDK